MLAWEEFVTGAAVDNEMVPPDLRQDKVPQRG